MNKYLSKIVELVLIAITIIVSCLYFFGGNVDDTAEYVEPVYTNGLMFLMYGFVVLAALLVLVAVVANFISDFQTNSKGAIKSILGVAALFVLLIVFYLISSGEAVEVLGMDPEDMPTVETLKLVDMQLYTIYVLTIGAFVLVIANIVKKYIGK